MSSLVEWQSWVRSPQTLLRQIGIGIFRFELKHYRLLVCCKTAKFNVILWIRPICFFSMIMYKYFNMTFLFDLPLLKNWLLLLVLREIRFSAKNVQSQSFEAFGRIWPQTFFNNSLMTWPSHPSPKWLPVNHVRGLGEAGLPNYRKPIWYKSHIF